MTNTEKLLQICQESDLTIPYFTNPDFDLAIISLSHDNRVVYDYSLMVQSLIQTEGCTEEEAKEWIDYNTIRSLDYIGKNAPIIIFPLNEDIIEYKEERTNYMNAIAKFEKVSYEQFKKDFMNAFPITDEEKMDRLFMDMYESNLKKTYENIKLPKRGTKGSAGYDFFIPMPVTIKKGSSVVVPTGIRCSMENGWVLEMYPRSGHGFKSGIHLANTVGIIDSDYYNADNEGHIQIKMINDSVIAPNEMVFEASKAFCQGIFKPFGITIDDESEAERTGGFGSTDKN